MMPSAALRRKQRLGVTNRAVSWVLLVLLVLADVTYRTSASDPVVLGDSVGLSYRGLAWALQIAMIVVLFLHAGLSLYVFGRVPFRRTLRVFHIYFGYALLVIVLASQTTFGWDPWHGYLTVLMYLSIAVHIALGVKFSSRRRTAPGPPHP